MLFYISIILIILIILIIFLINILPLILSKQNNKDTFIKPIKKYKIAILLITAKSERFDLEKTYWKKYPPESPLCNVADGISSRVARLKALGNAIVPQCSQYIGECIVRSGLLDDI